MRRLVPAALAVTALALAGCAPSEPSRTSAEACESVTTAWSEFSEFAQTPGRDDGEMVAMRDGVVETLGEAIANGPDWTATALGIARDRLVDFGDGAGTSDETLTDYQAAMSQLELFVSSCIEEGHLPDRYAFGQ